MTFRCLHQSSRSFKSWRARTGAGVSEVNVHMRLTQCLLLFLKFPNLCVGGVNLYPKVRKPHCQSSQALSFSPTFCVCRDQTVVGQLHWVRNIGDFC